MLPVVELVTETLQIPASDDNKNQAEEQEGERLTTTTTLMRDNEIVPAEADTVTTRPSSGDNNDSQK